MDLDDVEEKFRRNLVVFSTTILLCSFLSTSMQDFADTFIGKLGANASPLKIYVVASVVWIYLYLRYWHSNTRQSAIILLDGEFRKYRERQVRLNVQRDLDRYTKDGSVPKIFNNAEQLIQKCEQEREKLVTGIDHPVMMQRPRLEFTWGRVKPLEHVLVDKAPGEQADNRVTGGGVGGVAEFSGEGSLALYFVDEFGRARVSTTVGHDGGAPFSYTIPRISAAWIALRAFFMTGINSRPGLDVAWVVVMAFSAAVCLLWRAVPLLLQ